MTLKESRKTRRRGPACASHLSILEKLEDRCLLAVIPVSGGGSEAIRAALASAGPGDVIEIAAGNYDDTNLLAITTAGTESDPIVLRAADGARPKLPLLGLTDVKHFHVKGFEISEHPGETAIEVSGYSSENLVFEDLLLHHLRRGIYLREGKDFAIRDSVIYEMTAGVGSDATGITVFMAKNIEVSNSTIYDFTGDAIQLNDGPDDIYVNRQQILVDGNLIYIARPDYRGCTENAIDVKGEFGGTVTFSNNVVYGFHESNLESCTGPSAGRGASAINMNSKLDSGGSHLIVRGNLIYDGNVAVDTGLWSAEIYNNLFYDLTKRGVTVGDDELVAAELVKIYHNTFVSMPEPVDGPFIEESIVSNNLFFNAGHVKHATDSNGFFGNSHSDNPPGSNPITGNNPSDLPGLVDPDNLDFHLLADSPLVDAGADLGIAVDRDEKVRTDVPDVGALEYAPIIVTAIDGDTSEDGGSATFTVVLGRQPAADVSIAVSSSDLGEGALDKTSVVFTAENWDSPQTVTVTGLDDLLVDGDIAYSIVLSAVDSGDPFYSGLDSVVVPVTNRDNEDPLVLITETDGSTAVAENGNPEQEKDTFNVVLTQQPTSDVVIDVAGFALAVSVSPATIRFTADNWNVAQPITVQGLNDNVADGDANVNVIVSVNDALSDDAFDNQREQNQTVTVYDVPVNPQVTAPTGATNPALPTFAWEAVSGATTYNLWLIDQTTGELEFSKFDITGTEFTLPSGSELAHSVYRFWFSANNAHGFGEWSGPHDFTVGSEITIPAPAVGTGTTDTGNPARPQIDWTAVSGADSYSIWLVNLGTGTLVESSSGITTNSFTPSSDLANGTYRIWIKSRNSAGTSAWGSPFDFNVGISAPTIPTNFSTSDSGQGALRPQIDWDPVTDAASYSVWLINKATGTLIQSASVSTNAFVPAADLPGPSRIWVRAVNTAGSSAWSNPFDINFDLTAPAAPSGQTALHTNTGQPTIQWNAVPGAASYAIWFINLDSGELVSGATGLTNSEFTPGSVIAGGNYRYWVRAVNAVGSSGWSAPFDFAVSIASRSSASSSSSSSEPDDERAKMVDAQIGTLF